MTRQNAYPLSGPAMEHGAWSGKFEYPDTTGLVNLPTSGFSLGGRTFCKMVKKE